MKPSPWGVLFICGWELSHGCWMAPGWGCTDNCYNDLLKFQVFLRLSILTQTFYLPLFLYFFFFSAPTWIICWYLPTLNTGTISGAWNCYLEPSFSLFNWSWLLFLPSVRVCLKGNRQLDLLGNGEGEFNLNWLGIFIKVNEWAVWLCV